MRTLTLNGLAIAGLTAVGVGLWWQSPSWALIVIGGVVFIAVAWEASR